MAMKRFGWVRLKIDRMPRLTLFTFNFKLRPAQIKGAIARMFTPSLILVDRPVFYKNHLKTDKEND